MSGEGAVAAADHPTACQRILITLVKLSKSMHFKVD